LIVETGGSENRSVTANIREDWDSGRSLSFAFPQGMVSSLNLSDATFVTLIAHRNAIDRRFLRASLTLRLR
jgi:hypothetical protein